MGEVGRASVTEDEDDSSRIHAPFPNPLEYQRDPQRHDGSERRLNQNATSLPRYGRAFIGLGNLRRPIPHVPQTAGRERDSRLLLRLQQTHPGKEGGGNGQEARDRRKPEEGGSEEKERRADSRDRPDRSPLGPAGAIDVRDADLSGHTPAASASGTPRRASSSSRIRCAVSSVIG